MRANIEYVIIACCTYKRPLMLAETIKSLLKVNFPENIKTEILIVDNDCEQSAKDTVIKFQQNSDIKIHYALEKDSGLANVRNKALNCSIELGATHILFIDDDEVAEKDWLVNHIEFYNSRNDISVSSGPTYKKFDKQYPKYIVDNNFFKKPTTKKTGQYRKTCASGNVFFSLDIVKDNHLYFSKDFNYLGGEDMNFFNRVTEKGYKIGWNDTAVNYELIDDKRANVKWLLNRAYFNGYASAVVKFQSSTSFVKRFFYIATRFFTAIFNLLITIFSIFGGFTVGLNALCLALKNIGKLAGAVNMKPVQYYQKT